MAPAPNGHTAQPTHTTPPTQQQGQDNTTNTTTPKPATATRDTTPPGGVTDPTRAEQDALDNSVPRDENGDPTRPPDPADGPWVQNINGTGPDTPGRNNNCVDVALSTVDTYTGNPTAAAARTPDPDPDGNPSDRGENGGRDRIENTLGARFSDLGNGRDAFDHLENTLRTSGHGSQAVIITQDPNGRAHAWNAVNHNGRITYIDAQTGRTSPDPLHSGNNGVFAIPLDANRHPVGPHMGNQSRPASEESAARHTSEASDSADRRPPEAPAGAGTEGDKPPERPRGSAEYDTVQNPDDTHYDMLPEPSQAQLRETNEVLQTDLKPVNDRLKEWSENGKLRSLLHDGLADEQGGIRKQTLIDALPGFGDLTEGQQGAVVAALARMDLRFHATSSVGVALDPHADNPNSPSNFTPATDDPEKIERSNKARETIEKLMDKAGIKSGGVHYHNRRDMPNRAGLEAAIADRIDDGQGMTDSEITEAVQHELDSLEEHKGDWSRKNYAVVEVRDPENNDEIRYVVDSSLPMSSPWGAGVHSEPHAMDWIQSVNERREAAGQQPFEPISLYTEREPCGHASGNDCSDYLANEVEDGVPDDELGEGERKNKLRIHYGVGFRRGVIAEDADLSRDDGTTATPAEAKDEARAKFKGDFNNYVNRLKTIWEGNAVSGQ
ncbi:toxin glutamine deamidase domain-containing protein [Streptomyces enissocaesilis]|uniref:toxin glutamine deamidase domain-containing protein n=1 Tax=Streptomyces enissocaesilis TaxID=332589 RepID=UPI0031DAD598